MNMLGGQSSIPVKILSMHVFRACCPVFSVYFQDNTGFTARLRAPVEICMHERLPKRLNLNGIYMLNFVRRYWYKSKKIQAKNRTRQIIEGHLENVCRRLFSSVVYNHTRFGYRLLCQVWIVQ